MVFLLLLFMSVHSLQANVKRASPVCPLWKIDKDVSPGKLPPRMAKNVDKGIDEEGIFTGTYHSTFDYLKEAPVITVNVGLPSFRAAWSGEYANFAQDLHMYANLVRSYNNTGLGPVTNMSTNCAANCSTFFINCPAPAFYDDKPYENHTKAALRTSTSVQPPNWADISYTMGEGCQLLKSPPDPSSMGGRELKIFKSKVPDRCSESIGFAYLKWYKTAAAQCVTVSVKVVNSTTSTGTGTGKTVGPSRTSSIAARNLVGQGLTNLAEMGLVLTVILFLFL